MKSIMILLFFISMIFSSCQKTNINPDMNTAPARDIISPANNLPPIIGNIPDSIKPLNTKKTTVQLLVGSALANDSSYYIGNHATITK